MAWITLNMLWLREGEFVQVNNDVIDELIKDLEKEGFSVEVV